MALDYPNIKEHPNFIFQDDEVIVMLAPNPITPGQLQIFPNEHFTILEQIPNPLLAKMFTVANKLSTILFENINCQGTNIIVDNGIPAGQTLARCSINVIPRKENDHLNLMWPPQKYSEEQLGSMALRLSEETGKIIIEEERKVPVQVREPQKQELLNAHSENLLIKQFRRLP